MNTQIRVYNNTYISYIHKFVYINIIIHKLFPDKL